jgi:hypothetical protein
MTKAISRHISATAPVCTISKVLDQREQSALREGPHG